MKMNIHALRQRRIDLKAEGEAIIKAADTAGSFTEDQRTKLTTITNDLQQLEKDIQLIEGIAAAECDPGAARAASGEPARRGVAGAKVYNRLSDQILASGGKPTSRSAELAPFTSLADQMKAIRASAISHQVDPRLLEIRAALGGTEDVPADGGFLVIPEYAEQLIKRSYEVSQLASRCFRMPMSSARLVLHAVDEDSRKDGSRWGGILAYWLAAAGTFTPSKPKFREMQLVANKLIALCYATEELLDDAPAWLRYVNEAVPQELAFQIDVGIISGPGAGQPLGINNSGAVITQAKESAQATATVVTNNILKMFKQLFARSRATAAWFINQEIEDQLYTLALANPTGSVLYTNPLYTPPGINGNNNPYGLLLGRPVIPIEQASALGTLGDINLFDLQQYLLAEHSDVRADSSIHVAFLTGEEAFRFQMRLDGQSMWKKPLTPYKGGASFTVSPFINLAARP